MAHSRRIRVTTTIVSSVHPELYERLRAVPPRWRGPLLVRLASERLVMDGPAPSGHEGRLGPPRTMEQKDRNETDTTESDAMSEDDRKALVESIQEGLRGLMGDPTEG